MPGGVGEYAAVRRLGRRCQREAVRLARLGGRHRSGKDGDWRMEKWRNKMRQLRNATQLQSAISVGEILLHDVGDVFNQSYAVNEITDCWKQKRRNKQPWKQRRHGRRGRCCSTFPCKTAPEAGHLSRRNPSLGVGSCFLIAPAFKRQGPIIDTVPVCLTWSS